MKIKKVVLGILAVTLIVGFISCDNKTTAEEVKEESKEAIEATGDFLGDKKDALKKEIIGTEESLDKRMEEATEETKEQFEVWSEDLNDTKEKLKKATNENIEELEAEFKKLKEEIKNGVNA